MVEKFWQLAIGDTNADTRQRLLARKSGRKWALVFLNHNSKNLLGNDSCPLYNVRYTTSNTYRISLCFGKVQIVYQTLSITELSQSCNLDNTGFTPGRNVIRLQTHRIIAAIPSQGVTSHTHFTYNNLIPCLIPVFCNIKKVKPVFVFKGIKDPRLSSISVSQLAFDAVPDPWNI